MKQSAVYEKQATEGQEVQNYIVSSQASTVETRTTMPEFNLLDEEVLPRFEEGSSDLSHYVRKPSKVQVVLAILLLLLLGACAVFIALYALEKSKAKSSVASTTVNPSTTVNNPSTKNGICWTPRCLKSAAGILENLNTSVKPCDDFYLYSCGGFIKNNYIQDGYRVASEFARDSDKLNHALKELLEDKQLMSKYLKNPNSATYKAINYYRSCMNVSQIESAGLQPILDLIAQYGSWNITNGNWSGDSWILEKILARVSVDLGVPVFIGVDVLPSFLDASKKLLVIAKSPYPEGRTFKTNDEDVPSLVSKEIAKSPYPEGRTFKTNDEDVPSLVSKEERLKGYKTFMFKALGLLGANSASVEDDVKRIYDFEENFNSYQINIFDKKNSLKFMTFDQLNSFTSFKFNWMVYFEEWLRGTNNLSFNPKQRVMIRFPNRLKRIIDYITGQPKSLLANTIMWNVVRKYIYALPKSLRDAENEYYQGPGGLTSPRWRPCVSLANRRLQFATTVIYTDTHLLEGARKTAEDLFRGIKNQFIKGMNEDTWMTHATRTQAQKKLKAMKEMVGYPAFIKDPIKLNKYYRRVHVTPSDFLQNDASAARASSLGKIDQLWKPQDNTSVAMSPLSVNAYYSPQRNAITIPTGILQTPFYTSDSLKVLNYGRIGVVIGHEITHGFDHIGRLFDEKGNFRLWWDKESLQHFQEKELCLIKEYSKVTVFGRKVNGSHTLSENIADNGGLKYAFRAYQNWRETHGMEDRLPVLNLSNDQLFFVGYAQLWCTKYQKEAIKALMENEHSLAPVRVRIPLFNFPEFHKAFGCKAAHKSCSVW